MADTVQYLMEQMLPELEDLQRKKYFTTGEIKAIVKRRQDFEYKLKRRTTQKEDFLRRDAAPYFAGCRRNPAFTVAIV